MKLKLNRMHLSNITDLDIVTDNYFDLFGDFRGIFVTVRVTHGYFTNVIMSRRFEALARKLQILMNS